MTFRSLKRSSIALEIVKENKLVDNTYFIQKVSLFNLKFKKSVKQLRNKLN